MITLKPYDILAVKGSSWVSPVIRELTHSPYSHIALVLYNNQIAETDYATPEHITQFHYSPDQYDIYRYLPLTDEQGKKILEYITEHLGAAYDYMQVMSTGLHILLHFPIINNSNEFDCSEIVDRAFYYAGIDLGDHGVGNLTPADEAQSQMLTKIQG